MDMILDLMESAEECSYEPSSARFLMHGKEVGIIIGKKGETIKRLREETSANIHITDGSTPERIVTISGKVKSVYMAFHFICEKSHEAQLRHMGESADSDGGVTISMRMIVPAKQCGTIIGKGGCKIKLLREKSGANIQVASEMLPDSTERTVTMSGSVDDVTCCMILVCQTIKNSPIGPERVEYVPKSMNGAPGGSMFGGARGGPCGGPGTPFMPAGFGGMVGRDNFDHPMNCPPKMNPMAGMMGGMGGGGAVAAAGGMPGFGAAASAGSLGNATSVVSALAALAGSQLRGSSHQTERGDRGAAGSALNVTTQELAVANDMIGCIIGKGGSKIAEIRQMTGAMITISKFDDTHDDGQKQKRIVTMKGNPDQVALAEYLISTSVEMHKANAESQSGGHDGEDIGDDPCGSGLNPSAIPLANLLKNPAALNALSSLTNMNIGCLAGLQEMLSGRGGGGLGFMTGGGGGGGGGMMGRKSYTPRMRQVPGGNSSPEDSKSRLKFQPY